MLFRPMLNEAWISMKSNKLRSFLTILGIMIGVCAVVLMVAVGSAISLEINKTLESFGGNKLIIKSASSNKGGVHGGRGSKPTMTYKDAAAIKQLKDVQYVSPMIVVSTRAIRGSNNWPTSVYGGTPDYFPLDDWELEKGDYFSTVDVYSANTVAVIGKTIENELFNDGVDPIGQTIRIGTVPFTIVGVLKEKGGGMGGADQDDTIIVPLLTAKRRLTSNRFPDLVAIIMVKAVTEESLPFVEYRMKTLIRERHKIPIGGTDDFEIMNLKDVLEKVNSISFVLSVLLASVAAISLIVGSIGVMNMMLVSVTERTREIGIRKAIGAQNQDIMLQFLLEAILLSIVGSLIGMVSGIVIGQVAGHIYNKEVPISILIIIISMAVALVVGVVSGIFPALKATKLDPIEALRQQ